MSLSCSLLCSGIINNTMNIDKKETGSQNVAADVDDCSIDNTFMRKLVNQESSSNSDTDYNTSYSSDDFDMPVYDKEDKRETRHIKNKQFSLPENLHLTGEKDIRRRSICSENDISLKQTLSTFKSEIESQLNQKVCKECLIRSLQSKLNVLGIVLPTKRNDDVLEDEAEDLLEECDSLKDSSDEDDTFLTGCSTPNNIGRRLLKSLHRRTLSEIDWHELTRFAQGELFDPQSKVAKEIKRVIEEGKDELTVAFKTMQNIDLDYVVEEAERCVQCIIDSGWNVVSHWELPQWMRDNDYLWHMHRPQLPSFKECFGSMFRIHTETGNIWTHFVGLILIIVAMFIVYLSPSTSIGDFPKGWEEYLAFTAFFIGAIACLAFSWLYHTLSCHSKKASKLFSKLDYTGIACMIMGSFIPCIYYGFYCMYYEKLVYCICIITLGLGSIIVSLWDKFATPAFRAVRAAVFLALGCSGIVPVIHGIIIYGIRIASQQMSLAWLVLMAISYIVGALLYAMRIPERFFPGKCNLLFQSHQIFHVLVIAAAIIHLQGCCQMALYRIKVGRDCSTVIL